MPTLNEPSTGRIDVTVMYSTHDAFRRDLTRLRAAADSGRTGAPPVQAGWENFKRQLHVHHTVEDEALWPRLAAAVAARPLDAALVAEMEAEHEGLDPLLTVVDEAMARSDENLPALVRRLAEALGDHMAHEENSALPLIQEVLTPKDWKAFRSAMARRQGPSGAAVYVPWILDDTTQDQRARFLAAMPAPLAVVNRLLFEPRYRKRRYWGI
jgi:iron-sulfur cluster repair protein YtfE (RIC family)